MNHQLLESLLSLFSGAIGCYVSVVLTRRKYLRRIAELEIELDQSNKSFWDLWRASVSLMQKKNTTA